MIRAVKARTSCNARAETPEETPLRPYLHARSPRASRNGAGAASRACSVISQWPVAPHHMTLPTNARRPRSRLLVASWSLPRLVCSAWLLAVEASHPDQAFRYASACEGLLRRMLSPGGSLNGDPPFRFRGLNPGSRVSATRRSRFRWAGARMLRLGPPRLRELAQTLAPARV